MIQSRGSAGFLFKTIQAISISCIFFTQNLDGYFPPQLHVLRQVDFTHTAGTQFFQDSIVGNFCRVHRDVCPTKSPTNFSLLSGFRKGRTQVIDFS